MEDDGIRPVDHAYRDDVDAIFKQIYRDGVFGLFPNSDGPRLIELVGPSEQRLAQLELAVAELQAT